MRRKKGVCDLKGNPCWLPNSVTVLDATEHLKIEKTISFVMYILPHFLKKGQKENPAFHIKTKEQNSGKRPSPRHSLPFLLRV